MRCSCGFRPYTCLVVVVMTLQNECSCSVVAVIAVVVQFQSWHYKMTWVAVRLFQTLRLQWKFGLHIKKMIAIVVHFQFQTLWVECGCGLDITNWLLCCGSSLEITKWCIWCISSAFPVSLPGSYSGVVAHLWCGVVALLLGSSFIIVNVHELLVSIHQQLKVNFQQNVIWVQCSCEMKCI